MWAEIVQSVQRLSTGWTVRGSNPGVGDIFHTHSYRPRGQFRVLQLPVRGVDHPLATSAKVRERVEVYLYIACLVM